MDGTVEGYSFSEEEHKNTSSHKRVALVWVVPLSFSPAVWYSPPLVRETKELTDDAVGWGAGRRDADLRRSGLARWTLCSLASGSPRLVAGCRVVTREIPCGWEAPPDLPGPAPP
ncbi:hypothetical protein COCON_G00042750 [Conger conger]|uniref:Uncharacterized protein n=1 Tax=Conger conger TaxID=82655 RepID=A0A9Q1DU47_CONCO|nr:hypothetical protein COCON_G00042750 [Conger conger]